MGTGMRREVGQESGAQMRRPDWGYPVGVGHGYSRQVGQRPAGHLRFHGSNVGALRVHFGPHLKVQDKAERVLTC